MLPTGLSAGSFAAYPPEARALAVERIAVLRALPMPLLPLVLRELSGYDWRFPVEQRRLQGQMAWLGGISAAERVAVGAPFAALVLPATLSAMDWVNDAPGYMEQLTATLWSSGQMTAFRAAAEGYARAMNVALPKEPPKGPRLVMVVLEAALGTDAQRAGMYRRLRREGVLLTGVTPAEGFGALAAAVRARAEKDAEPYAHWYLEGAAPQMADVPGVTAVAYDALSPVRRRLLDRARDVVSAERSGPEELRSLMARMTPAQLGMDEAADPVRARFAVSLLTEGAGTQVFATTFAQWAARECLRRAEPRTLLVRFTARQRQQGMNEMLRGAPSTGMDMEGSLIDADQGAYYTWLNLQRLPGAEQARFLVWQEGQPTAVVIGPGLPRGTVSASAITMEKVLTLLG